jgi:hypothetical protein
LNSNSQTIVEKVALNSLKEMILGFSLNFSIFPKELLTSMVYMGVKVTTYIKIYGDGESWCSSKRTPLINPSKWTLMYR